jgi:hypothetical protein
VFSTSRQISPPLSRPTSRKTKGMRGAPWREAAGRCELADGAAGLAGLAGLAGRTRTPAAPRGCVG